MDPYDPSSPYIVMNAYAWNITNPVQALAGEKPVLQQVGPYCYREISIRFNVTFGFDKLGREILSYRTWRYFLFDRDKTPAHLDPSKDIVTTLNLPFQVLVCSSCTVCRPLTTLCPVLLLADPARADGHGLHSWHLQSAGVLCQRDQVDRR